MHKPIENACINRRCFLRNSFLSAGAVALMPLLSAAKLADGVSAAPRSRFDQVATDGRLTGSSDGGAWAQLANFGPHLLVREVRVVQDGSLQATLAIGSHSFMLKSRDGKTWHTQDYVAPQQG